MFESHFGFQQPPFAATPDPRSFFTTPRLREQVDELVVRLAAGHGICLLTSAAGLGKSLVCRVVAQELSADSHVLYIAAPAVLTPRSLFQTLLTDLDRTLPGLDLHELRLALQQTLRELVRADRPCTLLVDEVHLLPRRLFEELRALTVLDEEGHPLLRLLLAGQPRLEEMLTGAEFDAVNQQLVCHHLLEPLSLTESVEYILHRVYWAGGDTAGLFSIPALDFIVQVSSGIPRLLNRLCDQSLLVTHSADLPQVGLAEVEAALESLRHLPLPWNEEFLRQRRLSALSLESPVGIADTLADEEFRESALPGDWPQDATESKQSEASWAEPQEEDEPWGDDVIEPESPTVTAADSTWDATEKEPIAPLSTNRNELRPEAPELIAAALPPSLPWGAPQRASQVTVESQHDFESIDDTYEPGVTVGPSRTFDEQALALEWSRRLKQEMPSTPIAAPPEPPRELPVEGRARPTVETLPPTAPATSPSTPVQRPAAPGILTPRFTVGSLSDSLLHDPEFAYDVIEPEVPVPAVTSPRRPRLASGTLSMPIDGTTVATVTEPQPIPLAEVPATAPAQTVVEPSLEVDSTGKMTVPHSAHPIPAPQVAKNPGLGRLFSLLRGKTGSRSTQGIGNH